MRNAVLVCIALSVLTLAVFGQVARFEFINYDDPLYVLDNSSLRLGLSGEGLAWAFSTSYLANYAPITWLTFLADFEIHGLKAGGYHLTNLLFHLANTLLLFLFLYRTTRRLWPSALAVALFAVHPLHVESVAWVSSRKDMVSTFFWLAAMLSYASYARRPRPAPYLLALALMTAGLLSKAMLVTFPFALLLLDVWPLERLDMKNFISAENRLVLRRVLLEKIPFLVPVIAVSAATFFLQERSGAVSSESLLSLSDRVANAAIAYAAYLGHTVWPTGLVVHYAYRVETLTLARALGATAILIAITAVALRAGRRSPHLIVGWLWFLGTLIPVIGLIQVGSQSMADRYTYVPLIGLFMAAAWGLAGLADRTPRARWMVAAFSAIAVMLCATAAWRQVSYWRDSVTLFTHLVDVDPDSDVGHSSLGKALYDQGEYERAAEHLEPFLRQQPLRRVAVLNLGVLYTVQGRLDEAIACYTRLIRHDSSDMDAHINLGAIFLRKGELDTAVTHAEIALERDPLHVDALINLGAIRLAQDRPRDALPLLQQAVKLSPFDAVANLNLAIALYDLGAIDRARPHAEEALRLDPASEKAQGFIALLDAGTPVQ